VREGSTIQIGRVLSVERKKYYGYEVMSKAIEVAKEKFNAKKIYIEAQCYAIRFYEKFGFEVTSEPFLEDDIPHVKMELNFRF
jgi:ElaA protein